MNIVASDTDEIARLKRLRSYEVLDTARETAFDRIVFTAAQLFRTPIALATFVDEHRQWHKAHVGLAEREVARNVAFCTETILSDDVLVVEDATQDVRFADSMLVKMAPFIRFYAGAPLITPDGFRLGALCVADRQARTLTQRQAAQLVMMASTVMQMLEARMPPADLFPDVTPDA